MENANVAIHATIRTYAAHKSSIDFTKARTSIICELTQSRLSKGIPFDKALELKFELEILG
ncbi:MAG: hypothetical protein LBJ36_10820 [Synergistaceae bacterium]|jgi:hypothetical protein|nr:hypothetical protein [Synergistaceae bacterium]